MLIADDNMKTIFNLKICDWVRWKKQETLFWALMWRIVLQSFREYRDFSNQYENYNGEMQSKLESLDILVYNGLWQCILYWQYFGK